jgi:hypothetical protein
MKRQDSKPKSAKQTSKTRPRTPTQLKKDAALLFKVINDPNTPDHARDEISGWADEIYNYAENVPDPYQDKRLFVRTFIDGMQNAPRANASRHVRRIIKWLREGQEPAAIAAWFDQERARIAAEQEAKNRTQPEPKDKLSADWRYWKLRRMERALRGQEGEKAQREARREFKRIAREAINIAASDRYHAEMMLPNFIVAIQQKGGASDEK